MLKTRTVLVEPDQKIVDVCNDGESKGWAVRQIVPNPAYGHAYVVFEAEEYDVVGVYVATPVRSFTGTEAPLPWSNT